MQRPTFHDDADAYEEALASVGWVFVNTPEGKQVTGTAVVVATFYRPMLLTAFHVIVGRPLEIGVVFPARDDKGEIRNDKAFYYAKWSEHYLPCSLVSVDRRRDLALLRPNTYRDGMKAISLASRSSRPGQKLFSIGCSGSALWRFSGGACRNVYEGLVKYPSGQEVRGRLLSSSIAINGGDSGSPVLTNEGQLVGINSGVCQEEDQVYHAIDITEINAFLATTEAVLKRREQPTRAAAAAKESR